MNSDNSSPRLALIEPNWGRFIQKQIEACWTRHQRLGLPQKYLDEIDCLIRGTGEFIPMNAAPVILTGEYIPQTILLNCHTGNLKLSGLIDFGDVMTEWGE